MEPITPPPAKKRKARRLYRATANRAFAGFLERLAQVNGTEAPYAYRVKTVVLFGSYATEAAQVGDVDLAIELEPKFPVRSPEQEAPENLRRKGERYHPRNIVEAIYWPRLEVIRALQAKSPTLSVCEVNSMPKLPPGTSYRVLLGEWSPGW